LALPLALGCDNQEASVASDAAIDAEVAPDAGDTDPKDTDIVETGDEGSVPDEGSDDGSMPDVEDTADVLDAADMDAGPPACRDHATQFLEEVAGSIFTRCTGCHNAYGLVPEFNRRDNAGRWVGRLPGDADYIEHNLLIIQQQGGWMLQKATSLRVPDDENALSHEGGRVFEEGGPEYERFAALYRSLQEAPTCETNPTATLDEGTLSSAGASLRKATLLLADRLPTAQERAWVTDEASLEVALDRLMEEPAFYDRMSEVFNDLLLTNQFHRHPADNHAPAALPLDPSHGHDYPRSYMFNRCQREGASKCCNGSEERPCCEDVFPEDPVFCERGGLALNESLTRTPLEIVRHVIAEDRPFGEILSANYTMLNPVTAAVYGMDVEFEDRHDFERYLPVQVVDTDANIVQNSPVEHAGVLSTHMFLRRYITTRTNLNRLRSRTVYNRFLDIEITELVEFEVNPDAETPVNPTRDDPVCRVCHAAMDPVAGFFMNRSRRGSYLPDWDGTNWLRFKLCSGESPDDAFCVRDPGYLGEPLEEEAQPWALRRLGQHIGEDPRFAMAMVQHLYRGLLGLDIVRLPTEVGTQEARAQVLAWRLQRDLVARGLEAWTHNGGRLKPVLRAMLMDVGFRARDFGNVDEETARALVLSGIGGRRLLTPESLSRRVVGVTGYPWVLHYNSPDPRLQVQDRLLLPWHYPLLFGGIDSRYVVARSRDPGALSSAIGLRMAAQLACRVVPQELAVVDPEDRRLFRHVEPDTDPETPEGQAALRQQVRALFFDILGVELDEEDPEVDAIVTLFLDTRSSGQARMDAEDAPESRSLPGWCRASCDFLGQQQWHYLCRDVPEEERYENRADRRSVVRDADYSIRAWQVVLAALLSDFEFLYE
jgi:hypothetical protein